MPRFAWLMAAVLVAGCLGGDDAPAEPAEPTGPGPSPDDETPGPDRPPNEPDPFVPPPSAVLPLFLTADGGLSPAFADPGTVPLEGSGASLVVPGADAPISTFESAAVVSPTYVDRVDVTLRLFLEVQAPTPPTQVFDLAAWFGSPRHYGLFEVHNLAEPLAPGEIHEVEWTLPFGDRSPLIVPRGEPLALLVTAVATGENNGNMLIHVGPDTPSGLTLTVRAAVPDPFVAAGTPREESFTGTIEHGAFLTPESEQTAKDHAFTVSPEANVLEVVVTSDSPTQQDVDLDILVGATIMASSHTPRGTERILVAGDGLSGLRGADVTIRVSAFTGANIAYSVTATES